MSLLTAPSNVVMLGEPGQRYVARTPERNHRMQPAKTREEWLHRIVDEARPMFALEGCPLPAKVRVAACPRTGKSKAIGLCWHSTVTKDGVREIWVDASLNDPLRIADVLVHELCHAALPDEEKHGRRFGKLARALHLEGKLTATVGGKAFAEVWEPLLETVGAYPGGEINLDEAAPKPKSYNNVKFACNACEGLFYVALTRAPSVCLCPFCGSDIGTGED